MLLFTEINRINNRATKNNISQDDIMRRTSNLFYNLRKQILKNKNEYFYHDLKIETIRVLLCLFYALYDYNKKYNQKDEYNVFVKKYRVELNQFEKILEMINSENINQFAEDINPTEINDKKMNYLVEHFEGAYNKFRGFLALYYSRDKTDIQISTMINEQISSVIFDLSVVLVGAVSGNNRFNKSLTSKERSDFIEEFRLLIVENDWVVFTPEKVLNEEIELRNNVLNEIKKEGTLKDLIENQSMLEILRKSINTLNVLKKGVKLN